MRVLAYRGPGRLVLEERPEPSAGPGEVVVKVEACSVCGTDLRIAAGKHAAYAHGPGRVPGHEIVGTVAEVGAGAAARQGERVFVAPNYGCGRCRYCTTDRVNLCPAGHAIGVTEDGGFADYLLVAREAVAQGNLIPVGAEGEAGALALAEPLACVVRGSAACRIAAGDVVVVYGGGPIGLLHVALARLAGAGAVVVCEPNPERQERAAEWGATEVVGTAAGSVRSALVRCGAELGADAVVVAAPSPDAQAEALEVAAPAGRVNFFAGLPSQVAGSELATNLIHYKELEVLGTTASTNGSCREAVRLIGAGLVETSALVGATLNLASANEAFEMARTGQVLKVVVNP